MRCFLHLKVRYGPKKLADPQRRAFLLGFAVAAAVAALMVPALAGRWRTDRIDPILREAWGPALRPLADVLIVVGCPAVARTISSHPGLVPKVNNTIEAPAGIGKWYAGQNLENRSGLFYMFPSRGYIVFSDSLATTQIGTLLSAAGTSFHAVPEPSVRPMAIHELGLVLIGSPAIAPFIARLLKMTPFSVHFDPVHNDEVISDGPPESAHTVFVAKRNSFTNRFSTVCGLITVLPSQPGRDRPERTLIFSGITGSPGAQAAAQFFSSPVALRDLQARFRRHGYDHFPAAYQVVVRCGVDQEVAMNSVYETHRIMSTPPVIE